MSIFPLCPTMTLFLLVIEDWNENSSIKYNYFGQNELKTEFGGWSGLDLLYFGWFSHFYPKTAIFQHILVLEDWNENSSIKCNYFVHNELKAEFGG